MAPNREWTLTHNATPWTSYARITGQEPVLLARVQSVPRRRRIAELARIESSDQLGRLAGIGQVFVGAGIGHTSRLAHCEEVSLIAAEIASELGLDPVLAASIGLAHDCGHLPFSHVGEVAAREHVPSFHHAVQGARILRDLRVSWEILDGVAAHSWARPSPATAEGEVVRWADRIAYLTRDYADAVSLGLFSWQDGPASLFGESVAEQRSVWIQGVVTASRRLGAVCMAEDLAVHLARLRAFNSQYFYSHAVLERQCKLGRIATHTAIALVGLDRPRAVQALSRLNDIELLDLSGLPAPNGLDLSAVAA